MGFSFGSLESMEYICDDMGLEFDVVENSILTQLQGGAIDVTFESSDRIRVFSVDCVGVIQVKVLSKRS